METITDYLLFTFILLVCFAIILSPIFFWIRWTIRSYKKGKKWEFRIAGISLSLFLLGYLFLQLGPEKYFEHNTLQITETGFYYTLYSIMILLIPPSYFYFRWVTTSYRLNNKVPSYITLVILFCLICILSYFINQ